MVSHHIFSSRWTIISVAEVRLASLVLAHKLGVLPTLPATPLTLSGESNHVPLSKGGVVRNISGISGIFFLLLSSVVQNGCGLSMKDMLDQVQKFLPLDPIDLTWVAEETSLSVCCLPPLLSF